jgi:hypothetical protein
MPNEEFRQAVVEQLNSPLQAVKQEESIRRIGDLLGKALMPGPILQLYAAVLQRTIARSNQGLRLTLHFLGSAKEYQRLPWELVRINGRLVATDRCQAIVRTVDLPEPAIPLAVEKPPYRILVTAATPPDLPPLQYEKEAKQIKEALSSLIACEPPLIQMQIHYNVTLAEIEGILREGDFHILHFIGHAAIVDGNGILVFVDDIGQRDYVDGHRLGDALRGTDVRVAFLSSHETAYGSNSGIGVGEALLQVGLPIVVGYNYGGVTDETAIAFTSAFYTELVRQNSPEQAMFAGRRALAELFHERPNHWVSPVLLTRTLDGKFWTGEAGFQVQTFIREGRLVTEATQQGDFDAGGFARSLLVAKDSVKHILAPAAQLKAHRLIAEAEDAIDNSNPQRAIRKLSEASTHVDLALSNQEKQQEGERRESKARWTVLGVSVGLLLIVAVLGYALRFVWTPSMSIPVIALPVSVLVWSFVGGVAAMLQAFVGAKSGEARQVSYEWLLWRPVVGTVMGSVVYLAIAAGLVVLGQDDLASLANTRNPYFLWALAFIGGFSDKFAIFVFDNIVRTFSKPPPEPAPDRTQEPDSDSS